MEPWAPGEELEEAELREKELQDGNCGSLKVGGGQWFMYISSVPYIITEFSH